MLFGGWSFISYLALEAVNHDLVVETQPSGAYAYLPGRAAVREAEDPPIEALATRKISAPMVGRFFYAD